MNISKLLGAVKNISQVYEGVKNSLFKKSYIEEIANYRWQQCKECPEMDAVGKKCAAPGTQPCCAACGCSLAFKTRALSAECPLKGEAKRWDALMNADEEAKLMEKLNKKE